MEICINNEFVRDQNEKNLKTRINRLKKQQQKKTPKQDMINNFKETKHKNKNEACKIIN